MSGAIRRRGLMLILSSPSGAGKTTLTRLLLQAPALDLTLSISVTTRERRSSEVGGIHYHFIKEKQFLAMRDSGELLEWAEVHGNYLRYAARAGRSRPRAGARRAVRHRLSGHAAGARQPRPTMS